MSKKRLNETAIMNDLSESAFFRQPEPTPVEPPPAQTDEGIVKAPPLAQLPDSSPAGMPRTSRTIVHPVRPVRVMKSRHPFDIYQDQLESLQRLSAEERMQGGLGSMSKMVRDAIDAYLESRGRTRE